MDECCSRVSYVFGGMLTFLGLVLLIAFAVKYVHPYVQARAFRDDPADCVVLASDIVDKESSCYTHDGETSTYPCLRIKVAFTDGNRSVTATAYLEKIQMNFEGKQCFYQMHQTGECQRNERENQNFVQKLERRYGNPGQRHECFPKLDNVSQVIIMKMRGHKVRDAMVGACGVLGCGLFFISLTLWCQWKVPRNGCCSDSEEDIQCYNRDSYAMNDVRNSNRHPPAAVYRERYEAETVL